MTKKNVIIQKLHGIEVLACTDILCLDKTGTITDGTMEVVDTVTLNKKINLEELIANINTEEGNNATDIALKNKYGIKRTLKVDDRVPFSSSKKCSITEIDGTKYFLGALEYISDKKITDYEELKEFIEKGYRIITLSKESLFKSSKASETVLNESSYPSRGSNPSPSIENAFNKVFNSSVFESVS